ncbi:hypothetical protein MVLG_03861 [Microbotryum lychnidis-dioicae p1A1 Lamole]|uniref:Uncharacterized protein n=1 Tax=Microbotryum lychnidis-dioicae (strain p1A1 Lamole / MvSl-1064) TaxID=683840 RepID=U5H9H0_USTV1|nr:hypothetical protein MVLG_03861 [Microbotryum lychnidis-dioicae p1A1 Lamole]|eukprot:KDE05770.1 hypothetical protein MVLG_03861 [Microbotryum lychnidis-dioicae p1A1 Lamole]
MHEKSDNGSMDEKNVTVNAYIAAPADAHPVSLVEYLHWAKLQREIEAEDTTAARACDSRGKRRAVPYVGDIASATRLGIR